MSLDPLFRESNIRDSIKKFFVDNLYRSDGVEITFDTTLSTPKIQGIEVDKWVVISFGSIEEGSMARADVDLFCCTKLDAEGFKLAQLRDRVVGLLTDSTKTDCYKRITLYRSYPDRAWEQIGTFIVQLRTEPPPGEGPDGTNFKIVPITLRWGSKV